jgi:multiple sugar transport system substrate-binding protein
VKLLFASIAVVLALASAGTWLSYPDHQSEVPVIYWVTDRNPARNMQVHLFHQWLIKNGHVTAEGKPAVELRLDSANNEQSKKIIQGVSGVGGDVMDLYNGGTMRYFQTIGLLTDVTDWASELQYDPTYTWDAIRPEITTDGRQYMFPCNVTVSMYWVNKATFENLGVPVPPRRWTFDEFETLGLQFVTAANQHGRRRRVFFADQVGVNLMHRSLGLGMFNETLTRCTLDDPRFVEVLERMYKWTFVDRLLPSSADRQGFSAEAGYGGPILQLFNRGEIGMFRMGRYALIQLRRFEDLSLSVSEPPHGGFPTTTIETRAAALYIGGRHQELSRLFQAFLASEDYNMQIVRDADALPPNPRFTLTDEFYRPADYPREWGCHEAFADAAREIAIGGEYSPFVLNVVAQRELVRAQDLFMNGRLSAKEAAAEATSRINAEIQRTLEAQPALQAQYDALLDRQDRIDRMKAGGEKIPASLIDNPFLQRYYLDTGLAVQE